MMTSFPDRPVPMAILDECAIQATLAHLRMLHAASGFPPPPAPPAQPRLGDGCPERL